MSEIQVTSEQIEKARNANLALYFEQNGYEHEVKRSELHIKGYGGLFVNMNTNQWYCFSQSSNNGGKNAINCLTDVIGMDFKTAVTELSGDTYFYSHSDTKKQENKTEKSKNLELPEKDDNMKKVFAYLCSTRKIDKEIVSELVKNGLLYQNKKGNAVFLHNDENGKINGAEIQGTNTFQRFKGVAAGTSDSVFSFRVGKPEKVYIFESAIDLLSFKQLANQEKIQNSLLVSMAGLKPNSIKKFSESDMKIYSCVDNDEAGIKFTTDNNLQACRKVLEQFSVKDWNELLQKSNVNLSQNADKNNEKSVQKNSKNHH